MKKIKFSKDQKTREKISNPYVDLPLHDRLINSKAVDLNNNYQVEKLGNGYSRIKALNENKLIR